MSDDEGGENRNKNNNGGRDGLDTDRRWSLNRYFEVLTNPRRRHALYYLNDHRGETITLDTLAKQVTAMETAYSPDTLIDDEYTHVRKELYHNHLPRMADHGIVDFDPRSEDIRFHHPSRTLLLLLWVSHLIERTV